MYCSLWIIHTHIELIPTEHLPRLIKSTSCDKHFQSLPVLCGRSQCPVDHLGDGMDQDSLRNVNNSEDQHTLMTYMYIAIEMFEE